MISNKLKEAICSQIQFEFQSAYIYLAMSAYCESKSLKGFAHWLKLQYQEEMQHVMKIYDYLLGRGGIVQLKTIDAPPASYGTPIEVFEKVIEHERYITGSINKLFALAVEEQDFATQTFLQWFINEQVEEEAAAEEVLGKLKIVGTEGSSLLYMDQELGKRVLAAAGTN